MFELLLLAACTYAGFCQLLPKGATPLKERRSRRGTAGAAEPRQSPAEPLPRSAAGSGTERKGRRASARFSVCGRD